MLKLFLKNWILLLILVIFTFIISLKTSAAFFYLFFWLLVSLIIISLLWTIIAYFATIIHLERQVVTKTEEDSVVSFGTLIKNNGFLPCFNLVIEDYISCAKAQEKKQAFLIEYLKVGSSLALEINCLCPLRGKYKIGPITVYFFDPFGIFFFKKTFNIYSELFVYPKTFNIKNFPTLAKGVLPWFGIETSRVSGDEDEFFGIREYKTGDPIKKIHWISTARKNNLIVKQFQRQSFFRATLIFNLEKEKNFGEGKERVAEYIIRIAASIAKYLIERGISLDVIAHSQEIVHIPFNKGMEQLEEVMKFFAIAQAESRVSLGEIFEEFSRHIPNDSSLIVIMPDTDWDFLPSMLLLKNKNISVIPLVIATASFLDQPNKQNILNSLKSKLAAKSDLHPMFFARGDNLEEPFLKY